MSATSGKIVRAFGLALLLIAAAAGSVRATAPNLMTYQGRLKEAGLPVTGVRSVDVQLCPDATTLSCNSTGSQSVSVANGLFRTTFTVPSGLSLETGSWFVQVVVNGAAFGPREMLSAGAYAIYASSASTLIPNPGASSVVISSNVVIAGNGFTVGGSALVVGGGNVGVGTASPGSTLEVNGKLTLSGEGRIRVSGAGSAAPTVTSCGTGATIVGSNTVGRVTIGSTVGLTSCQIVFGTSWGTNPPVCHFFNESSTPQAYAVTSVNNLNVTFTGNGNLISSNVISYICLSY